MTIIGSVFLAWCTVPKEYTTRHITGTMTITPINMICTGVTQ